MAARERVCLNDNLANGAEDSLSNDFLLASSLVLHLCSLIDRKSCIIYRVGLPCGSSEGATIKPS